MDIAGGSNPLIKQNEFYHNYNPIYMNKAGGQVTNNNFYYNYTTPIQIGGDSIVKGHYPQFRGNYIYLHDEKQYAINIYNYLPRLNVVDNVIFGKNENILYILIIIIVVEI